MSLYTACVLHYARRGDAGALVALSWVDVPDHVRREADDAAAALLLPALGRWAETGQVGQL